MSIYQAVKRLSDEEIIEAVEEYQINNDLEFFEKLLFHYMDIAIKLARRYQRNNDYEDILSAALLGLTIGLKQALDGRIDNDYLERIPTYLYLVIRRHIIQCINESYLIIIPDGTYRHLSEEQIAALRPKIQSFSTKNEKGEEVFDYDIAEWCDGSIKALEELEVAELNDFELFVIACRAQGYTYQEIGDMTGYSHVHIHHTVTHIRKRCILRGIEP